MFILVNTSQTVYPLHHSTTVNFHLDITERSTEHRRVMYFLCSFFLCFSYCCCYYFKTGTIFRGKVVIVRRRRNQLPTLAEVVRKCFNACADIVLREIVFRDFFYVDIVTPEKLCYLKTLFAILSC